MYIIPGPPESSDTNTLELELQVFVIHNVGAGNQS